VGGLCAQVGGDDVPEQLFGAAPSSSQRATTSASASPSACCVALNPTSRAARSLSPANSQTGVRVSRSE
jgi:hypothetical protein